MGKFIDNMGATRHALTKEELESIYKDVEDLQADLTFEEYEQHREAFTQIKALIHLMILQS